MQNKKYITTKEFSDLAHVSKHTLFHYDAIQLFCPEIRNDQGYRYYSIDQLETFETILILKDIGMSLKDIKEFMDHRSPESVTDLFSIREKEINQQIQKLKNIKDYIHNKRNTLSSLNRIDFSSIHIQEYPNRYYFISEVEDESDASFFKATNEIIQKYKRATGKVDYTVSYIQYKKDIENHIYDNYTNVIVLFSDKIKSKDVRIFPQGKYVTVYHKGDWRNIQEAYIRLLEFVKENNLTIDDKFIEFYLMDNLATNNPDEYIRTINVQII